MAFRVPTMNLTCDIYTSGDFGVNPPRLTGVTCQVRGPSKITVFSSATFITNFPALQELVIPAGTDLRGTFMTPTSHRDVVVISAYGAGYPFQVYDVYDVAKGFTNEYRIGMIYQFGAWTPPLP
jgi:hypothetical protein